MAVRHRALLYPYGYNIGAGRGPSGHDRRQNATLNVTGVRGGAMSENNLRPVAFPTLNETQIGELGRCTDAAPRLFHDGEALFTVGQRNMDFFIVKSGEVEIIEIGRASCRERV